MCFVIHFVMCKSVMNFQFHVCRAHQSREADLSLHPSSFQTWMLPTPTQDCRAAGCSPSPVALLGFQPRSSDKEAVIRTHPLCISIVSSYKGCSKRRHLTCIWEVPSPFTPIKDLLLFHPVKESHLSNFKYLVRKEYIV